MIVYSFAWRRNGHSPCNVRLALAAKRILESSAEPILIMAQRSIADVLREMGVECHVVKKRPGYEGSEEVTRQATPLFRESKITKVIPVAQPFLQLTKCITLIRGEGFRTESFWSLAKMVGWIGFDHLSVQPATRGPLVCLAYTVWQILTEYRPPEEQSEP
ncbi:MAG TPA: hypothetical protein VJJ72_02100 [Candidatus Paceibacterota bacterium]